MTIRVAKVIDSYTLVLNVGSKNGFGVGQRFLVYAVGEDVTDPETGDSLGALEIVKGTGTATHVQERMSTVASDMKASASRTVRRPANSFSMLKAGFGAEIEETLPAAKVPFEDVQVGDLVKVL